MTIKLGIKLKEPVFQAVVAAWPAIAAGAGARAPRKHARKHALVAE